MDELKTALNDHLDQLQGILEKVSAELRVGMQPAVDNFIGFFHAIDWKEPWLVGLMIFHFMALIVIITSRKNINFQMYLFLLSTYGMASDYGIMKEEMSKLRGRKSVPGMNSRKRENGKKDYSVFTSSITTFEQMAKMFIGKYVPPSMVTKLRNEITNFRQRLDESLFEAWERYKLSIDRCPNHNMLPVTQIDTFYNGLTLRQRDTINAAAGGTFMKMRPKECYDLNENMTTHNND
nr:transmembrane protein 18 [Tanacetum cinerariifolium]